MQVQLRDLQRLVGEVDALDLRPAPRHRLGEDPAAAADKFRALLDPSLRSAMGAAAGVRVRSGFAWSDYGARAAALYAGALDRRGSR